ncbi:YCF48-related protein [Desulfosporosinus sp. PR]|uniref:YCF48-related protein n=1 Tax=Candidatus Desulfosporosinus nitrosoreducens TaxID=3401928 RepID=UPI0027F04DF9|nr:YCF48-related protein [Desulfosporosinus sp. PR]MDQ7092438.1 YCF48-related protein [Desulfosporosinus sp. PR]
MYVRRSHIPIAFCLIGLLLTSGCGHPIKGTEPLNKPAENSSTLLNSEITNAKFAFLDDKMVWIGLNFDDVNSPSTEIFSSSDQGQTWSTAQVNNYNILSMQFVDREHGWAIGDAQPQSVEKAYCILSTKNSGQSWTKQFETLQTTRTSPCQIQFLNTQDGFARLNNDLFSTTDGGESWKKICSMEDFMSVDFKDNKEGWASNTDSILHTTDGGNIWKKEWSVPENMKKRLELESSKVIINSGFEGWALFSGEGTMSQAAKIILHRDQSGDWTVESGYYLAPPPFSGNPAPPETSDLFPINNASAFLIAYTPSIYPVSVWKTDDQGKTWLARVDQSKFPGILFGNLVRVNFENAQLGWAVIVNRSASKNIINIAKTEDEGKTWKVVLQK